jgi:glycerophosphoryl diester phosphodiesterase
MAVAGALAAAAAGAQAGDQDDDRNYDDKGKSGLVSVGPRPYFLIDDMADGPLKRKLQRCADRPVKVTDFSIGHRGAAMQFPEHTEQSYRAAARMGAGILECDVAVTKDGELVCRHDQCDLHTTTNILAIPELAAKCSQPFTPADDTLGTPASALCCTSDITLDEFRMLRGKMDAFNPHAKTVEEFLDGTANWRTDLYSGPTSGTLLTHKESIELFKQLGRKMTPELKEVRVMPDGFTYDQIRQKLIDEYKAAGVRPRDVWPQSFFLDDVLYWVQNEPGYGRQAVYLDDANVPADLPSAADLLGYKQAGINIWAPPIFALLTDDGAGNIVASEYARNAKQAGLDIITWTIERSGILADGNNGFYYQTYDSAISREGDMMRVLDALAKDVGVLGVFTDWPGTVSYYASCMKLK